MTTCVFLDAAGVVLDTRVMPAQWQRLIGEFLAPRLGGEPSAWGRANAYAAERMWARYRDPGGTPRETHDRLHRLWLREMCEKVGVPPPRDAGALADDTYRWVAARVAAPMPGVIDALRSLKARGLRLFTSTSQPSSEIGGYLEAIGVRELFDATYGTDIIDRWKTNAGFYRKILEHSGVRAENAATVDDVERCLDWAKRAGFRTFLLAAPAATSSAHELIASLSELVDRL